MNHLIGFLVTFFTLLICGEVWAETILLDFETEEERSFVPCSTDPIKSISVTNGMVASGEWALRFQTAPWREGQAQWPSFTMYSPVEDWSGYDRLVLEVITEQDAAVGRLGIILGGPDGAIQHGFKRSIQTPLRGYRRWVLPLDWSKGINPKRITRIHFFCTAGNHPDGQVFVIDRLSLLKKGEDIPPLPESCCFARDVVPMIAAVRAKESVDDALLLSSREHLADYVRFCRESISSPYRSFDMALGTATSMEKVRPRAGFKSKAIPSEGLSVRLARNEYESVQVLIAPVSGDLTNVKVTVEKDLQTFPKSNISVSLMGYVNITNNPPYPVGFTVRSDGYPGYERKWGTAMQGWWPDPIIDTSEGVAIRGTDVQSFWIRVHCPAGQKCGTYRGYVTVSASGVDTVRIPLTVRVNDFTIDRFSPLPLAISFSPVPKGWKSWTQKLRKCPTSSLSVWETVASKKLREKWCDFLADYFITWDDIYTRKGFDVNMVMRLHNQGRLGRFNLGVWDPPASTNDVDMAKWRKNHIHRINAAYQKAKEIGVVDHAYIYGCDEVASYHKFKLMEHVIGELKNAAPGVPIATTALDPKFGVNSPLHDVDVFIQLTRDYTEDGRKNRIESRNAGYKVWWYVCAGPYAPKANMFIESQGIEPRLLMGAQTVRMQPDGFAYYQIGRWMSMCCIGNDPFTKWNPQSFIGGEGVYHGDGSWTCITADGYPVPTIRLENFRDGLEDYAYAKLLSVKLAARCCKEDEWGRRAKELLSVPYEVMDTMSNYTDDPAALYRWRDSMADMIESD